MQTHTLRLVLGDQLNSRHSWYNTTDPGVLYVLMEIRPEATYVLQHIKKLACFFLAMRTFAEELRGAGHRVHYVSIIDTDNLHSFEGNLAAIIDACGCQRFEYQEPDEYRLDVLIRAFASSLSLSSACVCSEHFLTGRDDLAQLMKGKQQWRMETFYRKERVRLGLLMEQDGQPLGGSWNYDQENRNPPPPPTATLPSPPAFGNNYSGVLDDITMAGLPHFGTSDGLDYPISRSQSLEMLAHFTASCLPQFGTYQDSMRADAPLLYHSLLSFALNTKLISPREVVDAAIAAWQAAPETITLPQIEGFVRQIIGWREYMRGIYWARMPGYVQTNFLGASRPLPQWYWTGETKMRCLSISIQNSLDNAYAHHIQRLMVTGNFAILAGIDPTEVNAWYLGIYADAIEWVQLPNTHGMSQFADGGLIASKPYVSSGAYINRMSDYCKGCHYKVQEKTGPGACPFNSLYWHFLARHEPHFGRNPRMAQMYATWRKMSAASQQLYLQTAKTNLAQLDKL